MKTTAAKSFTATRNACHLCAPLGASLVFKGIRGAVPLLHGSQGCSTYIRRYLISHFKEPVDIACSNFGEETAIFGGGVNLKVALQNICSQYEPELVGIATTCLSETIGDDVSMFVSEYRRENPSAALPPIVHASTPSYQGTHMEGFHTAVRAVISELSLQTEKTERINLFAGMLSPADLRHLRQIMADFDLPAMILPDYAQTLDGGLWSEYRRIPPGGTPVDHIRSAAGAPASIELGRVLGAAEMTAGKLLGQRFGVPCYNLGLPVGVRECDRFMRVLETLSGKAVPGKYAEQRERLLDALVDAHKYVGGVRAALVGDEDLVVGLASLLGEIGVLPVLCASGAKSGRLKNKIVEVCPAAQANDVSVVENADFAAIESAVESIKPDLIIGSSKGYTMARRQGVPLVRVGFPIHDRIGGARRLHVGYRGTQQLFDRIVNRLIETRQEASDWGYTYM
ncbi:MAG TPA: nitrogenase component 1 [Desulfobacterales bacterium]